MGMVQISEQGRLVAKMSIGACNFGECHNVSCNGAIAIRAEAECWWYYGTCMDCMNEINAGNLTGCSGSPAYSGLTDSTFCINGSQKYYANWPY